MICEMSSMVTYALPSIRDTPRTLPRLRFTLRSLFVGVTLFCAALAVYQVGYWHGSFDGDRNNGDLTSQLQALQRWWIVEHPGVPCPQYGPPSELSLDREGRRD